jgi:protein-disulfide isomerase
MLRTQRLQYSIIIGLVIAPTVVAQAADAGITAEQAERIITELSQIRALLLRQVGPAPQPLQPLRPSPAVKLDLTGLQPLGSPNAPLTIVEFTDYQCPFCNRFYREVFKEVKKDFIDSGKVRFYSRDLPLEIHPNAMQAANAGRCAADQKQFWALRERMSANPANLDMSTLLAYGLEMSMDVEAFRTCVENRKHQREIEDDIAVAKTIGASGTPAFVIGKSTPDGVDGRLVLGALPYNQFKQELDKTQQ